MARRFVDCRDFPSEIQCTLRISGDEEEVVRAAVEHAVSVHGHQDTPKLRTEIRKILREEPSYYEGDKLYTDAA